MPQARTRGAHLASLNATLAGLRDQAKDVDALMKVMGDAAGVLIDAFKVADGFAVHGAFPVVFASHDIE